MSRINADNLWVFLKLIVGFNVTRARVRKWTQGQRMGVEIWAEMEWAHANDNHVRRLPRPKCFPKKCL